MPNDNLTSGYLMKWGAFTFNLGTAAFQKLLRQDTWRWVTQERFANDPQEQFIGRGSKIISMEGVIFAAYDPGSYLPGPVKLSSPVGTHQLDILRYYGDQATPYQMVDGRGNILGPWVLIEVQEDQEYFLVNGAPMKQTFRLVFRYFKPENDGGVVNYANAVQTATAAASLGASIAERLKNSGLGSDTANDIGAITQSYQSANSNVMSGATASNLGVVLGTTFGFSGAGYRNALGVVQSTMDGSSWSDIDGIVNNGLPSAAENFGKLGVTDQAAGNNALAMMEMAPGTADRGTFMANASAQLSDPSTLSKMSGLGVDLNLGAISQNDRVREIVSGLSAIQSQNPSGFANAFPPEQFGELNIMASNAPTFAQNVTAVSSVTGRQ